MNDRPELMTTRGTQMQVDAAITAVACARDGQTFAFGTVDGEIILAQIAGLGHPESWQRLTVHKGAVLCLEPSCDRSGFLSGGEDRRLCRIERDGTCHELYRGRRWVECVASTPTHYAFSYGKELELRHPTSHQTLKTLTHPSTVTGIAFDAKGKRVVASHYNGVSLWFTMAKSDSVRALHWKGSHTAVVVHPSADAVVTAMQENDLHGWRLADGHNMRMSGYPKRVTHLSFTPNGKWLATSGADAIVLWPFFGGGPMGKAPVELARMPQVFCSAVCASPTQGVIGAGFEDGSVLLAEIGTERVLPVCLKQKSKVSALKFSPRGGVLAFGTETGTIALVDLSHP